MDVGGDGFRIGAVAFRIVAKLSLGTTDGRDKRGSKTRSSSASISDSFFLDHYANSFRKDSV